MKQILYVLAFLGVSVPVWAQEASEYFPVQQRRHTLERLVARYAPRTDQWYLGTEGFIRTDRSILTNSFNGIVAVRPVSRFGYGFHIGYTYHESWTIEGGYVRSATHNSFVINRRPYPIDLIYSSDKNAFVLRGKRLLLPTSRVGKRSGIWMTADVWLTPNSGRSLDGFRVDGLRYRDFQTTPDTVMIRSVTKINDQPTGLFQLGLEYNARLSDQLSLGLWGKSAWGLGSSIKTDMTYYDNGTASQASTIRGTGQGFSVGFSLRYTYAQRYAPLNNIFKLRGNPATRKKGIAFAE